MTEILVGIHVASILGLAIYGLLGFLTLWLFLHHKSGATSQTPVTSPDDLPFVTVQLPVYNEREVVQRLIESVIQLDYPRDRLEIQVLDDSTDETTDLATLSAAKYFGQETNIQLCHRENRRGFKAGALEDGLNAAHGDFIAVFDADFIPSPDFLMRTVPYFLADSRIGAVQARWGHLNCDESSLTGAQAVALDKHFAIEQVVRHRANYFPKFNGSAGIWRRSCIVDSGGWQEDTVCEDLCLSTRAVLSGWKFHFADEVIAPAELPSTILAYKTQQARWAMGATQCLIKYARPILHASDKPAIARLYALLSMSAYMTHALLLVLLLVQLPLLLSGADLPEWLYIFSLLGLGQPVLFILAQEVLYNDWVSHLRYFPALLLIAIGTAPSNTLAVGQGLFHHEFTFNRTPKGPAGSYRQSPGRIVVVETAMMVYCGATLALAIALGTTGPVVLLTSAFLGFGYVAYLGLRELQAKN